MEPALFVYVYVVQEKGGAVEGVDEETGLTRRKGGEARGGEGGARLVIFAREKHRGCV